MGKKGKPMKKRTLLFLFLILLFTGLIHAEDSRIKKIEESELPDSFCPTAQHGDFLITNGKLSAIVGAGERPLQSGYLNLPQQNTKGSLLAFAPHRKGIKSLCNIGSPNLTVGGKHYRIIYSEISQMPGDSGALALSASATLHEDSLSLDIKTTYRFLFEAGRIEIRSALKNTGPDIPKDVSYGLIMRPDHGYSFSPFHKERFPLLNFRVYPMDGYSLAWINRAPAADPAALAEGATIEVHFTLLLENDPESLLQTIYEDLGQQVETATVQVRNKQSEWHEIIVSEAATSIVFYRNFSRNSLSAIPLPKGIYQIKAHLFPSVREAVLEVGDRPADIIFEQKESSTLQLKIRSSAGEPIPGKVTFIGLDPTRSPYFMPDNPLESGRSWETFKNSRFPGKEGIDIHLHPGVFLIFASCGPEYSMDKKVMEVFSGDRRELTFVIDRVIETPGLISVDPHLHTYYSDGRMNIAERLSSVAAEGVDVAISADHNYITDYRPALKKLGLEDRLAVIIGEEITKGGLIHYNTYPMSPDPRAYNNGAILPLQDRVTPMFEASRNKDPGALVQVNHPRSGQIGYFNTHLLDEDSAASAREDIDLTFDVLEVLNGPYFSGNNEKSIEDWFHLLNRGFYFPAVASSDAHVIDRGEPGYSRTYVMQVKDNPAEMNEKTLIRAIKEGKTFLSNGPILTFRVNGDLGPGDFATISGGNVRISLRIESAPWISISEARLIINGRRSIIFPVTDGTDVLRFQQEIGLILAKDSYIAAEVTGGRSLFPVCQRPSRTGYEDNAAIPYALTNPVFIDVDGNGRFDPPIKEKIRFIRTPGI